MISRNLSSRLLKPALSSASSLYSHSAPWILNVMTAPEFQPSRTGTLFHGSTRFCTDSSSQLFHEKPKYFQSSHSKNQGNHLAKLKILDAHFVISSPAHNVTFGSPLSSAGNIRFFSSDEEPESPNKIPDSSEMVNHMKQLSNLLSAQGLVQLITWIHLFSSSLVEIRVQCLLVSAVPICAAVAFRHYSSEATEEERQGI